MDHLLREHAPISDLAWKLIDDEARERLVDSLGARRLVDFNGPMGWQRSSVNLGRVDRLDNGPVPGVTTRRRRVLPMLEARAEFTVSREELFDADRGAVDVDFDDLAEAALRVARLENIAVFNGWDAAGIVGIIPSSPHRPVPRVADFADYPQRVAQAVEALLNHGIGGPYALAVSPDDHTAIVETTEHGGYPLFEHVRAILDGPMVRVPGLVGGVVLSQRGGDFLFESGQDLSVGYRHHDADSVRLYIEQTFTFHIATPEAAIALVSSQSLER
ncbi:family 1 encapsulin nanocompartment shell protein [Ruicaihuangia caeni]|uniref:Type 1 encapsulin shell protein n=1 Tax=Ruicaihuangia caeni TaxID=3042517 RepID=A0AAW6T8S8_9MICO|nr:family 1 encapsulin nanocompartment shell protein [Klugiella sp. YN-L-19]MDI2097547.1 family 1 encapsulin nanocompartment shell protein [Klugiella sp. YN-L-19]